MKLSQVPEGKRVRVVDVNVPLYLRRRIFELGCSPNATITVLKAQTRRIGGIYSVRGVMLGIRRDIADKVIVI